MRTYMSGAQNAVKSMGYVWLFGLLMVARHSDGAMFDKAIKTQHIDSVVSCKNKNPSAGVTCSYFSRFMVKEIDDCESNVYGETQLSVIPLTSGHKEAPCEKETVPNEIVISSYTGGECHIGDVVALLPFEVLDGFDRSTFLKMGDGC
jgi:hypothetical protein